MAVSPDGSKVAFQVIKPGINTISIISVDPVESIASVDVSSVNPQGISFISNEHLLFQVSSDKRIAGVGEFELSTAMTYNIKKKKINQLLTPGKDDVYLAQQGIGNIVGVSPDGKYVYMPAFSGEPTFVMGNQLDPPMALFKSKIDGNRVRIHKSGYQYTTDYFVGDNGDLLAREVFDNTKNLHQIYAHQGKKSTEIFSQETPYRTKSFIGLSIDEQFIYMLDDDKDSGREVAFKVSLSNGKTEGPLYEKADADIIRYYTDIQKKVIGLQYSGFNPSYQFFDGDLNARVDGILAEFPGHAVWITDISPDRNHVLVYVEGAQSSGDYFLFSKGKKLTYLTSSRPDIPGDQVHPVGQVKFNARDGLKIPTLITIPRGKLDSLKNLPAIVLPHGGPSSFDSNGFDYLAQAFAEQGYLVIQPQFRGSTGHGVQHLTLGYGEWGRKMQHDLTDAVHFFTKQGMIDSNRVCIVGASYGGYAALAGGAFTPDLYKCVVAENGVGNLKTFHSWIKEEQGKSSSSYAFWEAQIKGFGEEQGNNFIDRSPELAVDAFKAPVLLIHSEKDEIVPPRQSVTMYRALKSAGKKVAKVELKGEDHNISHQETRRQSLHAIINFVNENINK